MFDELVKAISEMKEQEALEIAKRMLDAGEDPLLVLECGHKAMAIVGQRFEEGEYFLPELMMSGELLRQVSDMAKPKIKDQTAAKKLGKVLMGTVQGDIHNIGKDIVSFLLEVNGFEVRDIGVDVAPEKFVEEIRDFQPQVVGLSGLLTVAYDSMKNTIFAINEAGLRDSVKIMIGGGQVGERIMTYAGADAYGKDAMEGITLAKSWIG